MYMTQQLQKSKTEEIICAKSILLLFLRLVQNEKGGPECSPPNLLYHLIVFHLWLGFTIIGLHGKLRKLQQTNSEAADPNGYGSSSETKTSILCQSSHPKRSNWRQPTARRALIIQAGGKNPKRICLEPIEFDSNNYKGFRTERGKKNK